jgi:thiamine-phosphate pyrophosphorylase
MTQIYLISPPKIDSKTFYKQLEEALNTRLIAIFQLRLKGYEKSEIIKITKEIKKICDNSRSLLILNDDYEVALEMGCDGVHLGINDPKISLAKKNARENFVIGASCYDSKEMALNAINDGADYVAFGAFFPTKTKVTSAKPTIEIIEWAKKTINVPAVAIGGITDQNCDELIKSEVDFIAAVSYFWDHPLGVNIAIRGLHKLCNLTK